MNELINEHIIARKLVKELMEAKNKFIANNLDEQKVIIEKLDNLVKLYPGHIRKEDKIFFPSAMKYLNKEEQEKMIDEMWEFDRKMIHEKYRMVVENLKP